MDIEPQAQGRSRGPDEPRGPNDPPGPNDTGGRPPHLGQWGETRLEPIHVPGSDGGLTTVRVHRRVNVATHPELRERVLSGTLHRVDGLGELAIPFVFHDPEARLFVLVIPPALRHRELDERAALLQSLAADPASPLPDYVREFGVAFGCEQLAARLADGSSQSGDRRADELDARAIELESEAERLRVRAEALAAREEELRALSAELDARARGSQAEQGSFEPLPGMDGVEQPAQVRDDEVEELDDLPREPTGELDLADAVELVDDGDVPSGDEQLVDEGEVEEVEEPSEATSVSAVGLVPEAPADCTQEIEIGDAEGDSNTAVRAIRSVTPTTRPPVDPPAGFLDDPYQQLVALLRDEAVWLFARIQEGHEETFREESEAVDLLVQLVVVEGYPVVLLALVDSSGDRPYARRAAFDPRRPEHRTVLDALRRKFDARVVLVAPDGRVGRVITVSAARGGNVALAVQRAEREGGQASIDAATAMERALAVPPPLREPDHPFLPAALELDTAGHTVEAVRKLSGWTEPKKLDRALLVLSVPSDDVEETFRRVLEAAVRFGVALPEALIDRASTTGVAADPEDLLSKQVRAFRQLVHQDDRGGLDDEAVARNWERLLDAASHHEVGVDPEVHEEAWGHIRRVRGPDAAPPSSDDVDAGKLRDMGIPELVLSLDHPKLRERAALELCRRGQVDVLPVLYRAVRKMPRDEVLAVVPRVVEIGEAAGDALIDGLGARKTFVRQASALALGRLKLRRALAPLLGLLQDEPSEVWEEVARVIGELGSPALKPLLRALREPRGREDRLALALAFLAENGCLEEVQRLREEEGGAVAAMAAKALTLREVARERSRAVRGEGAAPAEDSVLAFSKRLVEGMGGTG